MASIRDEKLDLFGGTSSWDPSEWTASDDRVRGGSSRSHLSSSSNGSKARFYGTLDTSTLGGAGFASQRTVWEDKIVDLSKYDGIELDIIKGDSKKYTFIIKDQLLPRNPENGREQSTTSYEYDFEVSTNAQDSQKLYVPWSGFTATYRGKEKPNAPKLDLQNIRRFSIMCRSFFDTQAGDFELVIRSISAVSRSKDVELYPHRPWKSVSEASAARNEKNATDIEQGHATSRGGDSHSTTYKTISSFVNRLRAKSLESPKVRAVLVFGVLVIFVLTANHLGGNYRWSLFLKK